MGEPEGAGLPEGEATADPAGLADPTPGLADDAGSLAPGLPEGSDVGEASGVAELPDVGDALGDTGGVGVGWNEGVGVGADSTGPGVNSPPTPHV